MSLDFNYKGVKREAAIILATHDRPGSYKKGDKLHHPVMTHMVWRLMAIGMTAITEKTYEEVYWRSAFYDKLHPEQRFQAPQPAPFDGYEPRSFSLQDVKDLIGLSTNVSGETRKAWLKRTMDYYQSEIARSIDRAAWEDIYPIYREKFPDCIVSE